ncbi:MAG: asparaginase [bacterium]
MSALLANVTRGGHIESQHFGHVAVVDREGRLVLAFGDPQFTTYLRSAAKPFQAIPLYEDSVPEVFQFDDSEMAVIMASHNGEERHVKAVASILQKCGRSAADLQCGVHAPLGPAVAGSLAARGEKPEVLHNNCSGKHAGMLAACVNRGWQVQNYLEAHHPHQLNVLAAMAQWADLPKDRLNMGIDGCGAPNPAMPVFNMARMYAALIASSETIPHRIVLAFVKHPEMIAGEERFDTEVMRATHGRILAKTGAEGIECIAIDGPEPLGMAIKVADGAARVIPVIVLAVLEKLQVLSAAELEQLSKYRRLPLRNHCGLETGWIEPAI